MHSWLRMEKWCNIKNCWRGASNIYPKSFIKENNVHITGGSLCCSVQIFLRILKGNKVDTTASFLFSNLNLL